MKPFVCKCCGREFLNEETPEDRNPNICFSCASLFDDVQDNMIIESAVPLEPNGSAETCQPKHNVQAESEADRLTIVTVTVPSAAMDADTSTWGSSISIAGGASSHVNGIESAS